MTEPLRFLADESCDHAVVRALRQEGHNVLAISEFAGQSPDDKVMGIAVDDRRILPTEDKDFGQLVFARRLESPGVILIRFPGNARQSLPAAILQVVEAHAPELPSAFIVVEPGRIRISSQHS